jgi:hypothetical protein
MLKKYDDQRFIGASLGISQRRRTGDWAFASLSIE